jgi:hypothetical protein
MSDSINDYEDIPPEDMTLYFSDLCMLREEGDMNMMSAPRWLMDIHDLPKQQAFFVFKEWAKSMGENDESRKVQRTYRH